MSPSLIRNALLSAGLVLCPVLAASADTPAPPPPVREGQPGGRPAERPEGRPGEGRPGAEGRPQGRADPMMMLERVQAVLNGMDLSAEQKTKIDEAVAAAKKSIEGQKEGEPRERMQATMETMGKLRSDIEATLNDEQRKVFAEKVPPRAGLGQGRPGEGRPGQPGEGRPAQPGEPRPGAPGAPAGERGAMLQNALNAALEKTDLTAEQKAKVKENFMAEIQKMMREGGGQRPGARPEGRPQGPEGRPQGVPPEGAPQRPNRPAQEI